MTINLDEWETECNMVQRGQTLRFNHTDCEAGQDTRRRLYLTRPASTPNIVLAYCHNCSDHGLQRDEADKFRDFGVAFPDPEDEDIDFNVPSGLVNCVLEAWPNDAVRWRIQKGLTIEDCHRAGIKYDPSTHRVFLPMYPLHLLNRMVPSPQIMQGYQLRRIQGNGPKYLTALRDKSTKPHTRIGGGSECCYLVEDLASGLVMARAFEEKGEKRVSIVVNYGVKCTPEVLADNCDAEYNIVWLDNDGDHIAEQAETIRRTWELLSGKICYVEDQYNDPKTLDGDAIIAVHEWWRSKHYD